MRSQGAYHEGELAVQELTGERAMAERLARGIAPSIMVGAVPFLKRQRLLAAATADAHGEVWVSTWFGAPGFAESLDEGRALRVDRQRMLALEVDPVFDRLSEGAALGVLAIELETRRRLRVNGTVQALSPEALRLGVREAFANCPKYIAQREWGLGREGAAKNEVAQGLALDAARQATIARCDTLFVGSLHPERGADASHRGGAPGFVHVEDQQTLRIPDYAGNGMYQTLGNLHATPRAGVVFVDFEGRRLLHVTGRTSLSFDESELVTGGTGRSWRLHVERWVEGALPSGVTAELIERSPYNPSE